MSASRFQKLNNMIKSRSAESVLVVANLPDPPAHRDRSDAVQYMQFIETLSAGLPRALFIHGTGLEMVTFDK